MGTYSFTFWVCVLFYMRCLHISSANVTSTTPTLTGLLHPESTMMDQTDTTHTDPITSGNLSSAGTIPSTQQRTMTTTATEDSVTATLPGDQTTTATQSTEPVTSTFSGDQTTTATQNADFPRLVLIVAGASASAAVVIISLVLVIVCCTITKQNISPNYEHADIIRKNASRSNGDNSTNYEESDVVRGHRSTDTGNVAHGDTNPAKSYQQNLRQPPKRKEVSSTIYEELGGHLGIELREATPCKTDVPSSHSDPPNRTAVTSTIYEASDVVRGHLGLETSELPPCKPDSTSNSIFYIYQSGKRNDIASVIYEAPDSGHAVLGTLKADAASSSYSSLCQLGSKEVEHDYLKLHQYDSVTNEERLPKSMQLGKYSDPRNLNICRVDDAESSKKLY